MKFKLIKESSGFGYNATVANWLVKDEENLVLLNKLKDGFDVELPDLIAKNIHNLVCIETGEIVSKSYNLKILPDEVFMKYKNKMAESKQGIKLQIDGLKLKKLVKEPKKDNLLTNENIEESIDLTE